MTVSDALPHQLSAARPRRQYAWLPVCLVVAVGVAAMLPIIWRGIPFGPDLMHHYRVALPFYDALHEGALSPGWNAASTGGYGDLSFRLYPPGTHYLLAFSRLLTGNWYDASLLAFIILSVIGALGVYFWARSFASRGAGLCAAFLFAFAPYHINELYQSFTLPEFAGVALLPFSFAFALRICRGGRSRDVAGLAASYALLVLTHLPLTIIGSLALAVYALFNLDRQQAWKTLGRLAAGAALGLAASAFFWVTVISERQWLASNRLRREDWFNYDWNFLFSSSLTEQGSGNWWLNIIALASLAMFLPALALLAKKVGLRDMRAARGAGLLAIFALLMTLVVSKPLWMLWPTLQEVQFPWRWLTVVSLAGAVATASTVHFWLRQARGRMRPLALLALGGVLIALTFTLGHTIREANYLDRARFEALMPELPQSIALPFWLPIWAQESPKEMSQPVEAGNRPINITSWERERRVFQLAAGAATEARVRTFYYPHWQAFAGGVKLATRPAEDGALLISVPEGQTSVELVFQEPARSHLAMLASGLGWLLIILLAAYSLLSKDAHAARFRPEAINCYSKLQLPATKAPKMLVLGARASRPQACSQQANFLH